MFPSNVTAECALLGETLVAQFTAERLDTRMNPHMFGQVMVQVKRLGAVQALERPQVRMDDQVPLQPRLTVEVFITLVALKYFLLLWR